MKYGVTTIIGYVYFALRLLFKPNANIYCATFQESRLRRQKPVTDRKVLEKSSESENMAIYVIKKERYARCLCFGWRREHACFGFA